MLSNNLLSQSFFKMKPNTTPDRIISLNNGSFQMDLKHMVTSPEGYKYVLVLVSLYTKEVDAAPMKTKTMHECVTVLKDMIKRRYIRSIGSISSIGVDKGSEFVNVEMKNFLKSKNIMLRVENTTIHFNATAVVERMISTITRDVEIYLTQKSIATGRKYNDWLPALEESVFKINNDRRMNSRVIPFQDIVKEPPVIKNIIPIGTVVYPFMSLPKNVVTGQNKYKFRNSDYRYDYKNKCVVTDYYLRFSRPLRYILDDNKNVSYLRHQLLAEYEL